MTTDELLTQFRADVPLPDEATSRRIYAQATTRRRSLPRKRFAVAVAVAALGIAGGLFATVGGTTADRPAATTNGDRFFIPLENVSINRDGGTVTSIAFTVVDDHYPNGTLAVRVVRADETPVIGYDVKSEPVYEEHFPMTSTGSTTPDSAVSTVSATLSPDTWDGGCQDAYYAAEAVVYAGTGSPDVPFGSIYGDHFGITGWFRCSSG